MALSAHGSSVLRKRRGTLNAKKAVQSVLERGVGAEHEARAGPACGVCLSSSTL